MKSRWIPSVFDLLHRLMLSLAGLLVDRAAHAEWRQEWQAELWHARHSLSPALSTVWWQEYRLLAFCSGVFRDAYHLRTQAPQTKRRLVSSTGAPTACLLALCSSVLIAGLVGFALPGVRAQVWPCSFAAPDDLVLLRLAVNHREEQPSVSFDTYQQWRKHKRVLDESAFYQAVQERVDIAGRTASLSVVHSTVGMFPLVHLPGNVSASLSTPEIVLSDDVWRRLGADERIIGRVVQVGPVRAIIAGVEPPFAWQLPGKADAWLLDRSAEHIVPKTKGFVIAHLSPTAQRDFFGDSEHTYITHPDGSATMLSMLSLRDRNQPPWGTLVLGTMLAVLALPAMTPLSLGDYSHPDALPMLTSWLNRLKQWIFFATKTGLIIAASLLLALDLTCLQPSVDWQTSIYIRLTTSFAICLFGLRWAWRDQRERCPECLHRLAHPARVGQPSRNFLAWSGTELICVVGHGVLHVPELPTSWFSTQRWLHFDSSWQTLFLKRC